MQTYSRTHLSDGELLATLLARVAHERSTTAALLADLGEVHERRLYAQGAYHSMHAYCVQKLGFSEDVACRRIAVAREARNYPIILEGIADGRFHVTGLALLASRLTRENADQLLTAAAHKSIHEIELLLASHFPRADVPTRLEPTGVSSSTTTPSTAADSSASMRMNSGSIEQSSPVATLPASSPAAEDTPRSTVKPTAPQRFALQVAIDQETYDELQYAKALLGHQVPTADLAHVLKLALEALVAEIEKRKFAKTTRPRVANGKAKPDGRHIPSAVKRQVLERDGGRCTFVSKEGRRCETCTRLEYDHVIEIARGGATTVENLRLRCRAHNQHTAECAFGRAFMAQKRSAARAQSAKKRARRATSAREERAKVQYRALITTLSGMGYSRDDIGRAAAYSESLIEITLAERLRIALDFLRQQSQAAHVPTQPILSAS